VPFAGPAAGAAKTQLMGRILSSTGNTFRRCWR
jgi:hypothetical protein